MTDVLILLAIMRTGIGARIRCEDKKGGNPNLVFFNPHAPNDTILNHCEVNTSHRYHNDHPISTFFIFNEEEEGRQQLIAMGRQLASEGRLRQYLNTWSIPNMLRSLSYLKIEPTIRGFVESHVAFLGAPTFVTELVLTSDAWSVADTPPPPPPTYTITDISTDDTAAVIGVAMSADATYKTVYAAHPVALNALSDAACTIRRDHRATFKFLDFAKRIELILTQRAELKRKGLAEPLSVNMARNTTDDSVILDGRFVTAMQPTRLDPATALAVAINHRRYEDNREEQISCIEADFDVKFDGTCRRMFEHGIDATSRSQIALTIADKLLATRPKRTTYTEEDTVNRLNELVLQCSIDPLWMLARPCRATFRVNPNPTHAQLKLLWASLPVKPNTSLSDETLESVRSIKHAVAEHNASLPGDEEAMRLVLAQSVPLRHLVIPGADAALRDFLTAHNSPGGRIRIDNPANPLCGLIESVGSTEATLATRLYEAATALVPGAGPPDASSINVNRLYKACRDHTLVSEKQHLPGPKCSECPSWDNVERSIRDLGQFLRCSRYFHGELRESPTSVLMDFSTMGCLNNTELLVPRTYKKTTKEMGIGQLMLEQRLRDVFEFDPLAKLSGTNWRIAQSVA